MALIELDLAWLHRDDEGQGLAEYALILALIAILAIVALIFLGGQVSKVLSTVGSRLRGAASRRYWKPDNRIWPLTGPTVST